MGVAKLKNKLQANCSNGLCNTTTTTDYLSADIVTVTDPKGMNKSSE